VTLAGDQPFTGRLHDRIRSSQADRRHRDPAGVQGETLLIPAGASRRSNARSPDDLQKNGNQM